METNNQERLQSVQLRGIVRNQPQQKANDGDCEDLINLRHQDGAWRGVGSKTKLSYSIVTDIKLSKIVHPSPLPLTEFVGYSQDEEIIYFIQTNGSSASTLTLMVSIGEGETFSDFAWINNTLIAYTSLRAIIFQYNSSDGVFELLGELSANSMPSPRLAVGEDNEGEDDYTEVTSVWVPSDGAMLQEHLDAIMADFLPKYHDKLVNGYIYGYMCFAFAWKLFDGNYILHQGLYPLNLNYSSGAFIVGQGTTPDGERQMRVNMAKPAVYYYFPSEVKQTIQQWYDLNIIQSFSVFMTPVRNPYDFYEQDVNKWTASGGYYPPMDFTLVDQLPEEINYYKVGDISIKEIMDSEDDEPGKYTPPLDNGKLLSIETNPALPVDNFSHHKLIPKSTYVYNSRLHLGGVKVIPGKIPWPFYDWFDSASADPLIGCFYPRCNQTIDSYQSSNYAVFDHSIFDDDSYALLIAVTLMNNGNECVTVKSIDTEQIKIWTDDKIAMRGLVSYPDIRATKIEILISQVTDEDSPRVIATYNLQKHPFHNLAYNKEESDLWYKPSFISLPLNESQYLALPAWNNTLPEYFENLNTIQVSEVNNAFYYPSKQSYRVGNPDYTIRAMIVAQEPMTEMQFGQFPLYAFTAGGVFALEYAGGGEVLYSRISQFLTDIINEGVQPMALSGGAIVYQEQSAVKVLIGRESKSISREVIAPSKNPVYDQELLSRITTDERISDVRVILESGVTQSEAMSLLLNSRIGFDHLNEEILFSRLSTDPFLGEGSFTLVYQLKSGAWYKRSEIFRDYIRMTGGYFGMINTVTLDSEENETYTIDFYKLSEENYPAAGEISVMESPWVYAQTRPMSLGSGFHKKLIQAIARFQGCNVKDMQTITRTIPQFGLLYNLPAVLEVVPDVTDGLELTFDDIANVPVADAESVSDWNTFFDLPTNGSPFTSVEIDDIALAKYGLLYTFYAGIDSRKLCPLGWDIPTDSDFETLIEYLGGSSVAGGKLKQRGTTYWQPYNTGGTNESKFNAIGCGILNYYAGHYYQEYTACLYMAKGSSNENDFYGLALDFNTNEALLSYQLQDTKAGGYSVRPVRLATESELLLPDGIIPTFYQYNDGKLGRCVKIGTQIWLDHNLCETKYRNGDVIPFEDSNWAYTETDAVFVYDDDPLNGYSIGCLVTLYGGSGISFVADFYGSYSLLSVKDLCGCVVSGGYFNFCYNITSILLPNCVTPGTCENCGNLLEVDFSEATSLVGSFFSNCALLTNVLLPKVTQVDYNTFYGMTSLEVLYMPLLTTLGDTVSNNEVFRDIIGCTITLTIPSALMTCNGGNPDGDIQYLQANNTVTIVTV